MSNWVITNLWIRYSSHMKIGLLSVAASAILFSLLGLSFKYGNQPFYISSKARAILVISTASVYLFYKLFLMKKLTSQSSASTVQSIDYALYGLFLIISTFAVFFSK